MIVWVIAGLLGLATGLRIGWALVNKQSLVSTAMILALGGLGVVAALNWHPLTLLIDRLLQWPNISIGLSQVALIACAAGSCVMITTVSSNRTPAAVKKIAIAQYCTAAAIAGASLTVFFVDGQQPEMSPAEYLKRNLGSGGTSLSWLLPLLYALLALSLVAWAGLRHSNRSRRGRALFVFTIGIVLIVLALAFVLLRAVGTSGLVGIGAAATLLGCAMLIVAAGSLLPSLEDWFGARRELRTIQPILDELGRRHPDVGIGVRPRGPLVFRVAERMSLISDALFLEASAADDALQRADVTARRAAMHSVDTASTLTVLGGTDVSDRGDLDDESDPSDLGGDREDRGDLKDIGSLDDLDDLEAPEVSPSEQAQAVASWIYQGSDDGAGDAGSAEFPGLAWLRQPTSYSDREWILEIARQYRRLTLGAGDIDDSSERKD
ncbi:hypothetical protein NGTWS0302_04040 [Mycolicibacterium cyprinidarum]|uniref:Uncharacterized protein n=1 Tax=Mycolicibacterium cyprinidarum TaxID=2860311 RepID=A0ABQ4V518_9MYCO|nr:hypothetical protein NGTWS1702_05000 [Mycolicibacterium sp. NGTWSNA01]GJF13342.1 hypothetical protein NGTWS0302_04040 [Mycolicibacterium sp. NGTWS0302]